MSKEVMISRKRKEHMQIPWGRSFEEVGKWWYGWSKENKRQRLREWTGVIIGAKTCWAVKIIYSVLNIIFKKKMGRRWKVLNMAEWGWDGGNILCVMQISLADIWKPVEGTMWGCGWRCQLGNCCRSLEERWRELALSRCQWRWRKARRFK